MAQNYSFQIFHVRIDACTGKKHLHLMVLLQDANGNSEIASDLL